MKKTVSLIVLFALILTLAVSAKGADYNDVLIMGDSISTGYGLSGAVSERPSYANKLKEALGSENLTNLAVDGDTSAMMLDVIAKSTDKIKGKDLIVFSIGGNDLLRTTAKVVSEGFNTTAEDLTLVMMKLMSATEADIERVFNSESANAHYAQMIQTYNANLENILKKLNELAPEATIILLNQYNPFSGLTITPAMGAFSKIGDKVIGDLNDAMAINSAKYGAYVCDTYTPFIGKAMTHTRILSSDIHPNEAGHTLIFETLLQTVNSIPTPETSDPSLAILAGLMISAAGLALLISKKNKA